MYAQKLVQQENHLAKLETQYKAATDKGLLAAANAIKNSIKRQKAAIQATREMMELQTTLFTEHDGNEADPPERNKKR